MKAYFLNSSFCDWSVFILEYRFRQQGNTDILTYTCAAESVRWCTNAMRACVCGIPALQLALFCAEQMEGRVILAAALHMNIGSLS